MKSYNEHLAFLTKMEIGSRAERVGFQMAKEIRDLGKDHPNRVPQFSQEPYEQERFQCGLLDGWAMFIVQDVTIE